MTTLGLTKDDSWQIGFVLDSVMYDAITLDDLKEWSRYIIAKHGDLVPSYVTGMPNLNDKSELIAIIMGQFPPYSPINDSIVHGITGIGYRRGLSIPFEDGYPTKVECLALLAKYPEIEKTFRTVFPFIEW